MEIETLGLLWHVVSEAQGGGKDRNGRLLDTGDGIAVVPGRL